MLQNVVYVFIFHARLVNLTKRCFMIRAIRDLGFFELKEVSGKEIFDIEVFEKIRQENPQLIAKLIAEKATAKSGIKEYVLKIEDNELTY